jgi:hypothetical protein
MAMSKKDYQALARVLYNARDIATTTDIKALTPQELVSWTMGYVTSKVADVLAADNPRFNRALFLEACETGKCKGMPR